ncbi:hypothetical protein H9Y05_11510 [Crocinitomicaceae bacterium CZZ-1]|uniref:Uncharacterized protein n=1 Tax=Taishania pollutisoli TaxID=2766479 RepID=A0A8J6PA29_9FLAO|nr:hypothetical protein [Taishania pollutisoli]MBC9813096.1 hypothetical protein [Taishania pollutisoli]
MENEIEHLKYLDTILSCLKNGIRSSFIASALFKYIEGANVPMHKILEKENEPNYDDRTLIPIAHLDIDNYKQQVFREAIAHLRDLKLVSTSENDIGDRTIISLTFKGRIKTTFGFVAEYEKEKDDRELRNKQLRVSLGLSLMQKWTIWIAIVLAAGGFSLSLSSFSKKGDNIYQHRCNCQTECKTNPKVLSGTNIKVKSISKETPDTLK